MWYIPFVRAYRALATYAVVVVAVAVVSGAIRLTVHLSAHDTARGSIEFQMIAGVAMVGISILATVMGLSLASENEGHLEVAWTKPASRERYALNIFGIDLVAMLCGYILTIIAIFTVADVWVGRQAVFAEKPLWESAAMFLLPVYIYALIALGSASLKRSRGMVAGLFWPIVLGLTALAQIRIDSVRAIAHAINTINPVVIFETPHGVETSPSTYALAAVLTAIALALAIVQWRRLEA
jgi:hypothetical protein